MSSNLDPVELKRYPLDVGLGEVVLRTALEEEGRAILEVRNGKRSVGLVAGSWVAPAARN
jgi:hypothetical protein